METATEEPDISPNILAEIHKLAPALEEFFPAGTLKMGGGTILQARWGHRISTDAGFFATPRAFNEVVVGRGRALEARLMTLEGVDSERSWVELTAIYCECEGVEMSIVPSEPLVREGSGRVVPGTGIETETTATILGKKVFNRMIEGGGYEVRDLYDLYTAIARDQPALERALSPIPDWQLCETVVQIRTLPKNWFANTNKPLLGVQAPPSHRELTARVCDFLESWIQVRGSNALGI